MQQQSQSTRRSETSADQSQTETAPEIKKETATMTALLWPAIIVFAIGIIVILFLAFS